VWCYFHFFGFGIIVYKTLSSLDQIIVSAVNKYGPAITQTDVHLDGVTLNMIEGEASLRGLFIGNPEGFNTDFAMKLDEVKVIMDLNPIMEDTIIIKEVLVQGPVVIYELASGGSNIDALTDNIIAFTGQEGKQQENDDAGPKLMIEDLYINNGNVSVSHNLLKGEKLSAKMPDIHLEDIGEKDDGASPAEVAKEIMGSVKSSVGSAVGTLNLDKVLGNVGGTIKEGASSVLDKGKEAGGKIKGLFQ